MITRYIKLDRVRNYLVDEESGERVHKFDPNNHNLKIRIEMKDGTKLEVPNNQIQYKYNNQIYFIYNDTLYTIDDGYRDILIKAGYLVFKDYDTIREENSEEGEARRDSIGEQIIEAINKMENSDKYKMIYISGNNYIYQWDESGFRFSLNIETIVNVVNLNQERKANNLRFLPFDKSMDKYCCYYISIFAQKLNQVKDGNIKNRIADKFIKEFIEKINLNEYKYPYHYDSLEIKYKILNSKTGRYSSEV